ncbi:MAG TPA: prephenate dehydrogenase/arogenate dehydrogenase family protein [Spirochaetota bacterium]|nr:prephenate dehydrogenase/arogenate dehydrogenase family protein [Spirochaetota bacterium]
MFHKIAVFGLGLLGGSLAKALKKRFTDVEIVAFGRDPGKIKTALVDGCVDRMGEAADPDLAGIELVVVSVPVIASIQIIRSILDNATLEERALVIDVGSVKGEIVSSIECHEKAAQFIGCHPMAGSEKSGYEHVTADLYDDSSVIITPHEKNSSVDIDIIAGLWQSLNARTIVVPPELHDLIVAHTSHLPHMVSCAVVEQLMNSGLTERLGDDLSSFIGKGFMDVTRIAAGSPDMWREICLMNRSNICDAMTDIIARIISLRDIIAADSGSGDKLFRYFSDIKNFREPL